MKKQKIARVLVALTALSLCLAAAPAMAASHAKHACVKSANCAYTKTGTHNKLCERGTHTTSHGSHGSHGSSRHH